MREKYQRTNARIYDMRRPSASRQYFRKIASSGTLLVSMSNKCTPEKVREQRPEPEIFHLGKIYHQRTKLTKPHRFFSGEAQDGSCLPCEP